MIAWRKWVHLAGPLAGLTIFLMALRILHHTLSGYHYQDIRNAVHAIPLRQFALAMPMVAFSYTILTLYDVLGFRYAGQRQPYRRVAFASFVGYALSNNVGMSFLSGGAIRYRLFSSWGVNAADTARVIAFCTMTGWLGFATVSGAACWYEPSSMLQSLPIAPVLLTGLGGGLLLIPAAYLLLSLLHRRTLKIRDWEFALPPPGLALAQILLGSADLLLASSVLFVLIRGDLSISFPSFAGLVALSWLAGMVSQVPGGVGVFETALITLLGPHTAADKALSALLVFRMLYYLAPLFAAAVSLAAYELRQRRAMARQVMQTLNVASPFVPYIFSFAMLACGAMLLFSGATPAAANRIKLLSEIFPLPIIELSHFLASVAGMGLILLARALYRRLDAAFWFTAALMAGGIVLSLLKGLDFEEALVLAVLLAALLPCHREFYRKTSLLSPRLGGGWIAGVAAIVICAVWLIFFSYKHVAYSQDLWWQFAFNAEAPRSMRAVVAGVIVMLGAALIKQFQPLRPKAISSPQEMDTVREIVRRAPHSTANLALLGDKAFLFNEERSGFIMYATANQSWVAMGDPVAPANDMRELVWRFRERCDHYAAWPVFYQVRPENLHLYPDIGLNLVKFGEEARVDLRNFTLDGSARKTERHTLNHLEKEGLTFEIIAPDRLPGLIAELKIISNGWLETKNTREKAFSLGCFDETYLAHFSHAILRKEGRIVAFANLWQAAGNAELSIDLMRYSEQAPSGSMDYLFLRLMEWGATQGYPWFNMGMAPLAGIEGRATAPLWNKAADFLYHHGERFYNFQGLRQYKNKFHPQWEPRYIASPGGLALPRVLTDIASLVNRGIAGTIAK